ncbi:MAG: right-handed parallel beta-helix repeat-containing protein, partial [Geminicoccaceae bacterium]
MATITVTTALDVVDAGDGALSLREAVAQANATTAADTIVFAAGLETQTLTLTGGELVIGRDLTIDGDRNNDGLEVVLSGGDNQRLLRTSGAGTDLTLQDLTMVDGHVGYGANGGGIFAGGGTSVTLNGSTLESCVAADGSGGGIFAESGSRLNVIGSTLRGNGAPYGNGGAIFGEQLAEVTIRHGTISHNGTGYYGAGGAISAWMLTIEDSIISDNAASHYGIGGAIEIIEGSATILRTSITSNNALRGGAIAAYASDVMLQNVTVAGNLAYGSYYTGFGGGIIAAGNSRVTLVETTVTGNRATNDAYRGSDESPVRGGGINITAGTELTLINSIVS